MSLYSHRLDSRKRHSTPTPVPPCLDLGLRDTVLQCPGPPEHNLGPPPIDDPALVKEPEVVERRHAQDRHASEDGIQAVPFVEGIGDEDELREGVELPDGSEDVL